MNKGARFKIPELQSWIFENSCAKIILVYAFKNDTRPIRRNKIKFKMRINTIN